MQSGYVKTLNLAPASAMTYAAKKASEAAPGVSKMTDINIILKTGTQRIWPHVEKKLIELYDQFDSYQRELGGTAVRQLQKALNEPPKDDLTNVTPITAAAGSDNKKA